LASIGPFAGLFEFKGYRNPVLAASVDGVGTKLKIASVLRKYDTVGIDIVHHCVNDILTCGAEPLFFLDYIATGKLVPEMVESVINGMAKACKNLEISLIGGETAEMPGFYPEGDFEVVGFIIGVVSKDKIIDGSKIEAGNIILGLPSSGLHTNGYSLVRKIFGEDVKALNTFYPELGRTLGEELLEPHRCYYQILSPLLPKIRGLAHITGGGIFENISRVLPKGLVVKIEKNSWEISPIFNLTQERGKIEEEEMYRVFNMGIGMAIICSPEEIDALQVKIPQSWVIGRVEKC
jgi:phosphoribosylformylglycinamidine cyclo-ligase